MAQIKSRRRKERAQVLQRLKGVYLECKSLSDQPLRAINLSEIGVGIEGHRINKTAAIGTEHLAKISVGYTIADVKMRLIRITPEIAGFEFTQVSESLKDAIRVIFEPELVGAALKYVPKSTNPLVYEDPDKNQIQLWTQGSQITQFLILILGLQINWKVDQGHKIYFVQNDQTQPIHEFLRKQLINLVASSNVIDSNHRNSMDRVLRYLDTV